MAAEGRAWAADFVDFAGISFKLSLSVFRAIYSA